MGGQERGWGDGKMGGDGGRGVGGGRNPFILLFHFASARCFLDCSRKLGVGFSFGASMRNRESTEMSFGRRRQSREGRPIKVLISINDHEHCESCKY